MEDNTQDAFGTLEIEDDFLTDLEDSQNDKPDPKSKPAEEPEEDFEEEEDEEKEKSDEKSEEEPEDSDILSDDEIIDEYGEEVDVQIVRHYNVIKDYLITNDDFKFDGSNIEEAYKQDQENRSTVLLQMLIDKLPASYKVVLEKGIENSINLDPETLEKLLDTGKQKLLLNFDEDDDDSIKTYLKQELVKDGTDEDDADDIIEVLDRKGNLLKEANRIKAKRVKEIETKEQETIQETQTRLNKDRESTREFNNQINDILEKSNLKPNKKTTIKNYIFGKTSDGESPIIHSLKHIYKDPNSLYILADLISNYDIKSKSWDLSKFEANIMTKEVNKVKSTIEKKLSGDMAFKAKNNSRNKNVSFNWDEINI